MPFNFKKIKPAESTAPAPAPEATAPDYSNKAVSETLYKRESPKAVSAAISNNPTLKNFLQHSGMDINQKSLKQMSGSEMGPYLASEGKEGLDIFMEDYPTAEHLEKALGEHKVEPRERDTVSYVAEKIASSKNPEKALAEDEYLKSVRGKPVDDNLGDVNPNRIGKSITEHNKMLGQKAVDKILSANKDMSEVANVDILKKNGINVESMAPVATEDGFEVQFDMEGLLNNKEGAGEYFGKLKEVLKDLGIEGSVGVNPATGKGKISINRTLLGD